VFEKDIEKLKRIDFRLNQELVSKPYAYIDKIKANLIKEQGELQKIIKANNDKYIHKMVNTEQKVSRVLTDTESLINQYNKKISDVNKNVESSRKMKEEINLRQKIQHA